MANDDKPTSTTDGWHLDKKVPLSLIFAMMVQAGMVVLAIAEIKKDVEVLKIEVSSLHKNDDKQTEELRQSMRSIQESFARLDAKMDRVIERRERP